MELLIVTGLSGAGKSQAKECLEDLGYFCIDNMPPQLIDDFVLLGESNPDIQKVAVVIDIRGGMFFTDLKESLDGLKKQGIEYRTMFLEASDAVLIRRFSETRRSHPLSKTKGTTRKAIEEERKLLEPVKKSADFVIDSSSFKKAGLHDEIQKLLSSDMDVDTFTITVQSFGFKHGIPTEADWVLDARFLPNPFYVPSLKKLTGNNKKIRNYVMKSEVAGKFAGRIVGLALDLIPGYIKEGKYSLTIAIGCTGGQHRSVALTNELADRFSELGKNVIVVHRDL